MAGRQATLVIHLSPRNNNLGTEECARVPELVIIYSGTYSRRGNFSSRVKRRFRRIELETMSAQTAPRLKDVRERVHQLLLPPRTIEQTC